MFLFFLSSPHKGTASILQAWIQHPHWPTITITSYNNKAMEYILKQLEQHAGMKKLPSNIRHIHQKLSHQEMAHLMWTHGVHLCLSGMEGFGHYLNEARAVGALVVATNYPPMNEMIPSTTKDGDDHGNDTGILVEPSNMLTWTNSLPFANVGPPEIANVMNKVVLPMSLTQRAEKGRRAQLAFEHDQQAFAQRMQAFQCYLGHCRKRNLGTEGATATREQQAKCAQEVCGLELE